MDLFPAIDLRGGKAVRLYQGDYDRMTVYNADPAAQARAFVEAGAKFLHVVDLDGANDDTTANMDTIAAIAKQGGLYIEVGGGIRDEERIRRYLDLGVSRCILGTVAVKNFAFAADMAQKYGYESPTAFNRAFQSVHGVAPSAARQQGIPLLHIPGWPSIFQSVEVWH